MKALTALSCGIGFIAAATFTFNAHAAAPCFENDGPFDVEVWHIESGAETKYSVVKPGDKLCVDKEREGYVMVAVQADEPPYIGQVKVKANGQVKIVKDSGGYFLASYDEEGKQIARSKLAQPQK